ncbi:MAG TPA: hypothetical protein VIJ46_03855, partial [Rhabdochlamydiaceae bacterium]
MNEKYSREMFDAIPNRIQFFERKILHLLARSFDFGFDATKPAIEFLRGLAERAFGIKAFMSGEIDQGEKQVAE